MKTTQTTTIETFTVTTDITAAASFPVSFDNLSEASDFFGDEWRRLEAKNQAGTVTLWADGIRIDTMTVEDDDTPEVIGTANIGGREYTITEGEAGQSVISHYNEIILHGKRGATYFSERWLNTNTVTFWSASSRFPTRVFDGQHFVIEEGTEGNQITLRNATYQEASASYATFNNA